MKYKTITLPDNLKELTYNYMKGIINQFDKEKKLNNLDALSLYVLAGNINLYLECEEKIQEKGIMSVSSYGNESISPFVQLQKQIQTQILNIMKEMGLTLHSRSKISLNESNDITDSPILNFLSKK